MDQEDSNKIEKEDRLQDKKRLDALLRTGAFNIGLIRVVYGPLPIRREDVLRRAQALFGETSDRPLEPRGEDAKSEESGEKKEHI